MFDAVNALSEGGTENYRIESFDGSRLVLIGSFDLDYYHDIELIFSEVALINCPVYFNQPRFSEVASKEEGRCFQIATEEGVFEIVADDVSIMMGKVYHYDRGDQLLPGERIAECVKKDERP